MSLLAVGSVALDTVETPHGRAVETLGGSAVYFAVAASFLAPVRLVGVVGEDFPREHLDFLGRWPIDTGGLRTLPGKTFRWSGRYVGDMNAAETLDVKLNVFGEFAPVIPQSFRDSRFVFLANGSPVMQRHVLRQMPDALCVGADTMNHWIRDLRPELLHLLRETHILFLNDGEARLLTGAAGVVEAGRLLLNMGARTVIVKKGEHGALLFHAGRCLAFPAYPTAVVRDPTGAGDSFAGGVMGFLARAGEVNLKTLKRALVHGAVLASFNVEDFSLKRFAGLAPAELQARVSEYNDMLSL